MVHTVESDLMEVDSVVPGLVGLDLVAASEVVLEDHSKSISLNSKEKKTFFKNIEHTSQCNSYA